MKINLLIISLFSSLLLTAQKTVNLTINWTFVEVVEGYDHQNRMVVTVDGKEVGQSKVFKETDRASYVVAVPAGNHTVRIENSTFYEGKWEPHTKENSYSVDAFYEGEMNLNANKTVNLVFNIDTETTEVTFGGSLPKAAAKVPLTVTWQYTNVNEGFDHQSRTQVYIDGKLVATSETILESQKASMTVQVSAGKHEVVIENYALYEGNWELHSRENDYSIDAFYSTTMVFKKKPRKINLVFDIETESTKVKLK